MAAHELVFHYAQSCASGKLAAADCGPIWQLGVIGALLLVAILALLVLRMRSGTRPGP